MNTLLHEPNDDLDVFAWNAGNIPFSEGAGPKWGMNCNSTPIKNFIKVFGSLFNQKGKGCWYVVIQQLLWFRAEKSGPFFSHHPSGIHALHDLNAYMVYHLHHCKPPSLTNSAIIWLHTIRSDMSISDKILQKLTKKSDMVDKFGLRWTSLQRIWKKNI